MKQLRTGLVSAGCSIVSSEVELRPLARIELPQSDREILTKVYTAIEDHEYVEHIVDNVAWPEQDETQKATA
jgi:transcriptional/translational regulatory protein YebC/TACO1